MKRLNLGCGSDIKEGYINLDITKLEGVDIVHNLQKLPYPFEDNYFDEIYARMIIEHLDNPIKIIQELYRMLKKSGKLIIEVPYETSCLTWSLPHKRAYNLSAFDCFAKNTRVKQLNPEGGLKVCFNHLNRRLYFPRGKHIESYILEPIFNLIPKVYEGTFLKFLFPALSIIIELRK